VSAPLVPLRITFINWRDIRNPEAGGAEVFTHEVAKRWASWGQRVSLLTSQFPGAPRAESIDGVHVTRMGRLRRGTFHARVQRELLQGIDADCVIDEINTIPFFTPLHRRRPPAAVALIHQLAADVWDAEMPSPLAALGRWLEPRMLRPYARTPVATVSDSTRIDLARLGVEDVTVIPNGRDDPPDLPGVEKEPVPTLLFVGRLAPNKRPDHAVEAFRILRERVPDARLWIVGRGPMEQELRATLPPGAELLGFLPRHELYERMARAQALLVPSVREGWGLVVVEANAVGTPAIGYDVAGIRDAIVDGDTGILVEAGDVRRMASAAERLVTRREDATAMSERAARRALEFSWDRTARELLSFIERRAVHSSPPFRATGTPPVAVEA